MPARPDDASRQKLRADLKAAIAERDARLALAEQIKSEAESAFWQSLARLKTAYHGAQADIAADTTYSRDHIAKQIKKHAARANAPVGKTGKPRLHPSPPQGKPMGKPRSVPMSQDPNSPERTTR
ncbi:hypothetical protein ACH4PU_30605 [Streptomyces sp. NPDC021100]|uniref:hypothetical protein n=1 Tax=Streptomyces sp. NPDC021100 TaxID=3365114 RepID=UPI0037AB3C4F